MKFNIKYDLGFFDGLEQALWFLEDEIADSKFTHYEGNVLDNHMERLHCYVEMLREKHNYGDTRDQSGREPYTCVVCNEL